MSNKGRRKNFIYHRLIAEYLVPKKKGKGYINHKDGNKNNNHPANLEWCTASENQIHACKMGLRGKPIGNIKYPRGLIEDIRLMRKSGFLLKHISRHFGVPISTVTHICLGSRRS